MFHVEFVNDIATANIVTTFGSLAKYSATTRLEPKDCAVQD